MPTAQNAEPVVVRRYARNRLYDASTRRHVTVGQLRGWAAQGIEFTIIGTESGADVSRALLA